MTGNQTRQSFLNQKISIVMHLHKLMRRENLRTVILLATCAGMLLPALVGGLILNHVDQGRVNQELNRSLQDKIVLLADSLKNPVWNYDLNAAQAIVNSAMLDPQIARIAISVTSNIQSRFLTVEDASRQIGRVRNARHDLVLNSEKIGFVEIDQYDGPAMSKFRREQYNYALILLGQCVLSFFLILASVHYWILAPLKVLTTFSDQLANGNLESSLQMDHMDEIGQLAHQMNQMRINLSHSFIEQRTILSNIQVGVIFVCDDLIRLANARAEQIFGYADGEMVGLPLTSLFLSSTQYQATRDGLVDATRSNRSYEQELLLKRHDSSHFWAEIRGCVLDLECRAGGGLWAIEDISKRKTAEEQLNTLAFYDPLTNLANRRLLLDRLSQALSSVHRSQSTGALLFIDLDNFKIINDTLGHDIGDQLLVQAANRLRNCVRENDTIARLGGDEFVALLDGLAQDGHEAADHARIVAEKIIGVLSHPYRCSSHDCHSSASVGITLFDANVKNEVSVEDILKHADLALYQAKSAGRKTFRFFDGEMQVAVVQRVALEKELRQALTRDEFVLHYQMQVDYQGRLRGAEALIRWHHPQRGLLFPGDFIAVAEDSGLIVEIGYWVIGSACRQLRLWANRQQTAATTISVNVSAKQLLEKNFVEKILEYVGKEDIDASRLKLELTESLLIEDTEGIIAKMLSLREKGIGFSLDDFGTGYSSLSYLKRLPLCELKIDKLFVKQLFDDADDVAIAKMIIALGSSLGLAVIAEGVETEEHRDFLAKLGCYQYQGYYYGRPLPVAEFESTIASWKEFISGKNPDNGGLDSEIRLASLRIGEPSIDDEHESLLNLLHRLQVASPVADKSEGFSTVLNAIGQQLSTHFEHEEEFFKKFGMPDVDVRNHIRSHQQIMRKHASLLADFMKDSSANHEHVLSKVEDWILVHWVQHDLKMKAFILKDT